MAINNFDKKTLSQTYLDGIEYEDNDFFFEEYSKLYPESKPMG
jgi:hypothetical protein